MVINSRILQLSGVLFTFQIIQVFIFGSEQSLLLNNSFNYIKCIIIYIIRSLNQIIFLIKERTFQICYLFSN